MVLRKDGLASNVPHGRGRFEQSERLAPAADQIYRGTWGQSVTIDRFPPEAGSKHILDREFAIDVMLRYSNGMIIVGQEKFLSSVYAKYRSLTIEYMNDWRIGTRGDWFNLASQFYMCGYESSPRSGKFGLWIIVNWPALVLETLAGRVRWLHNRNKDGRARADFKYCLMDSLPQCCVIASNLL